MTFVQSLGPSLLGGIFALLVAITTSRFAVQAERKKFARDLERERDTWRREFSTQYAKIASDNKAMAEKLSQQFAHAFLYVRNPELSVSDRRFIPAGANMVVGSDPACDITLPNVESTVSLRHALIQFTGDQFTVTDLASSAGTFLDEKRITRSRPLNDGASLRFGKCEARFVLLTKPHEDG